MRRFSLAILIAATVLTAVSSCAEREPEDSNKLEEKAFDAWMGEHVNKKDIVAVRQSNGIYVEVLKEGPQDGVNNSSADTIVWLRLDYTATDLYNNVFVTRNEETALQQGTYTIHTHYNEDYIFCGKENHSMISGQHFALTNKLEKPDGSTIRLTEGTRVRLYMPSFLAFGSSGYTDDQGYGGQYALSGTKPVIQELEVVEVIKDPVVREEKLVLDYALDKFGMQEKDTTATCFFIDTIKFNKELELKYGKEMSLPLKKDYLLTADSTAKIWFIGKFLDGFIFDTNIDTTYNRFYNRRALDGYYAESKSMSVLSYKPEEDKSSYISAFYKAIPKLRRGQWSRILFTSNYGYGATGLSKALQDEQEYYNYYMNYMYNSYYGSSGYGYGNGYGNGYYNSYYNNNYYNYDYYNYSTSSSEEEAEIVTEIQPYTPLIFEIYIEASEEDEEE